MTNTNCTKFVCRCPDLWCLDRSLRTEGPYRDGLTILDIVDEEGSFLPSYKIRLGLLPSASDADVEWFWAMEDAYAEETRYWNKAFFMRVMGYKVGRTGRNGDEIDKEAVRERIDIAALLSNMGIEHRKHGDTLFFRCIVHSDSNPSATFSMKKKVWHCHSCQAGGDVFGFFMEFHSCGFRQALEELARM